jgi:hypothetical protein
MLLSQLRKIKKKSKSQLFKQNYTSSTKKLNALNLNLINTSKTFKQINQTIHKTLIEKAS